MGKIESRIRFLLPKIHFVPVDNPDIIGCSFAQWLKLEPFYLKYSTLRLWYLLHSLIITDGEGGINVPRPANKANSAEWS